MWCKKARQIKAQQAEIARLTAEVGATEGDLWYGVAKGLRAEVEERLKGHESGSLPDALVTAVIEAERQALVTEAAEAMAAMKLAQLTAEAKAEINREAADIANVRAAAALRHFHDSGEAAIYQKQVKADLATARSGEVMGQARAEIAAEEMRQQVAREKATLLRLDSIRETTRFSGVFDLGLLQEGDDLEIGFIRSGYDDPIPIFQPPRPTRGGLQSTYNTDYEYRRIAVTMADRASLTFTVTRDAWFEHPDQAKSEQALLGGMMLHLCAGNPLTPSREEEPVVVRGTQIHMLTPEGDALADIGEPVWWATLNNKFVLADASTPGFRPA